MDKKHNDAEDIEKEDADIETEETEESSEDSHDSEQNKKDTKKEKPQLKKKKPKKEDDEDEYEDEEDDEYDDDDEYEDDDDEGGGKTKIVIISVIIAAAVAAAGIFTYTRIVKNNDQQQEQTIEEQQAAAQAEQERLQKENEAESQENADNNDDTEAEETETPTPTEEPIATSTPKPLPTATSTPTPFPEETYDDTTYNTSDTDDGTVNVSNDGTTGGIDTAAVDTTEAEPTQVPAGVIFIGDSRFRAMANIATENSDLWECSSSGDYNWLTGTAYSDVDPRIGKDTKVFISMGINDLTQYQSYASSIVAKAQEWMNKGATVYFVSVGPVSADSYISNQDISNFNTYMYQSLSNAGIPFIDAYNYLVQAGFETTDGESYTDMTSMALYNYINSLIGR